MKTKSIKYIIPSLLCLLAVSAACQGEITIVTEGLEAVEVQQPVVKSALAEVKPASQPALGKKSDDFVGYDFEDVVDKISSSVVPLQNEMTGSLKKFSDSVKEAEKLMSEDKPVEAIDACSKAIDSVLTEREKVLEPMWDGQDYLADQIGKVRERLSVSAEANSARPDKEVNPRTEFMLNNIAKRIGGEEDPLRKKRLVRHYNTIRNLARIRAMKDKLSPSQYKMWQNVLRVLENTAETHQRVLMGTEVLFAQFEVTLSNIQDSRDLIETIEGANQLLKVVRGLDQSGQGLDNFTAIMDNLQGSLDGLTTNFDDIMMGNIENLDAQTEAINQKMDLDMGDDSYGSIDSELEERIKQLSNS